MPASTIQLLPIVIQPALATRLVSPKTTGRGRHRKRCRGRGGSHSRGHQVPAGEISSGRRRRLRRRLVSCRSFRGEAGDGERSSAVAATFAEALVVGGHGPLLVTDRPATPNPSAALHEGISAFRWLFFANGRRQKDLNPVYQCMCGGRSESDERGLSRSQDFCWHLALGTES